MAIFSKSGLPLTSDSATRIIAGGPVGINIIANQSIGSASRIPVFVARAYMIAMEILRHVSSNAKVKGKQKEDIHRPHDKPCNGNKSKTGLRYRPTLLPPLHLA